MMTCAMNWPAWPCNKYAAAYGIREPRGPIDRWCVQSIGPRSYQCLLLSRIFQLLSQLDLQDVVEVGRTPAGDVVPAGSGGVEQVVAAGDVVEGMVAIGVVGQGVDLWHA